MQWTPFAYAAAVLIIALIGGLLPVFSKMKDDPERLKQITGIAAGIIIASAMLVVIPEGFALVSEGSTEPLFYGGAILAGFLLMLILEGSGIGHAVHEEHHEHEQ